MNTEKNILQRLKWYIAAIAWFCLIASLVWPALDTPFPFPPADHTATGFVVALSFVAAFAETTHGALAWAPLVVALLAFLISPATISRRPRSRWGLALWWGASLALLLIWATPFAWQAAAHLPLKMSLSRLMWGFYVYAGAHTLMFIASLMAPPPFRLHRKNRDKAGFPVIYPPNS